MRRRALAVVAVTFFMLTALLPVGVFAKSSSSPASSSPSSARPALKRVTLQDGQKIDTKVLAAMRDPNKQVMVIVQLKGDPVAVREATAGRTFSAAEKTSIRTSLKAPQAALAARIKSVGGRVIGTMQDAYNGIQVFIKASQVSKLAALPGVVKVHAVTTYTRDNVNAIPYVQAPAAWADGLTGSTEWIAVIDTGIDYYHANFGGSGSTADFNYGELHDTTAPAFNADGTTQAFPSAKVIGGYDFSGDDYNADDPLNDVPVPDPNPLDCGIASGGDGHGSHTAGTAAGQGVLANGDTYTGPYDGSTEATSFLVGPGVAPEAKILSYRVFGCVGSSSLITLAINQAVADGASVISMSLGSDFAAVPLADDPDVVASDNAAGAGIVVVAASGNAGAGAYITGVPGASNRVISVAAIDGTTPTLPGVHIALTSDSRQRRTQQQCKPSRRLRHARRSERRRGRHQPGLRRQRLRRRSRQDRCRPPRYLRPGHARAARPDSRRRSRYPRQQRVRPPAVRGRHPGTARDAARPSSHDPLHRGDPGPGPHVAGR